jgi:glycosyltransferase involved in cell wall biosynthesis
MNNHFFVIEDSSKNVFGGGQKISLLMMEILSKQAEITLFDTNATSVFANRSKRYIKDYNILYTFSKVSTGLAGILYKFLELVTLPVFLVVNISIILRTTRGIDNKIFYSATKKSLAIAYILNRIVKCEFIYHNHLVERNALTKFFLMRLMKKAKYVIAVSDAVKESINLPNVIRIYNPIKLDPAVQPKELTKEKVVIGFFGSLIKIKGLKYFLDSYKYLDEGLNIEYRVFGEGPDKAMFAGYNSGKIIFKGFTKNVVYEMSRVDILCFPSIIEEALGMVILEAFMSGVPVIATNIGGQAELVTDNYNGFLVPIKNANVIADRISYMVNNPGEYSRLSKNAIKSCQKFSYNEFEKSIHALIS